MPKSWFEPYLWIHVAGILMFPLWMVLCLLGLASGDPFLPAWMELLAIAGLGIGLILAMQLRRPFNIFSVVMVAVPTDCLDDDRRRVLAVFQEKEHRALAMAVAALLFFFLIDAYHLSPLVEAFSPVRNAPGAGISRVAIATIGFLGANLFLQVPLATLRVMVKPDEGLETISPVDVEDVAEEFTTLGWQLSSLAPDKTETSPSAKEARPKDDAGTDDAEGAIEDSEPQDIEGNESAEVSTDSEVSTDNEGEKAQTEPEDSADSMSSSNG